MKINTESSFETYRSNLTELNNWYKKLDNSNLNEANTRFHLIDELFIKCLGWSKDDLRHEETEGSEYADYTFYSNNRRCMIVEAKRQNVTFEIPAGFDIRIEYQLNSLIKDNSEIKAAIEQVIGYCNRRGVDIAAVSNGCQLIAFLPQRNDGINVLDGKAYIFSSLDRMEKKFLELWQIMSKPAVLEKRIVTKLSDNEIYHLPLKLSATTDNYPRIARRNELQADLQIVGEVILESINKDEGIIDDFLRETYCSSGALSQYALLSKSILSNRYSLLFEENITGPTIQEAVTKKGISPEVFAHGLSKRPILLLGDVGAGKTMFINYFVRIEANELIKKSFTLYIDLGSKGAIESDLKQFFLKEIESIFSEKYDIDLYKDEFVRGVYHGELLKFQKGIYGKLKEIDSVAYLHKEIEHLELKIADKSEHLKKCFTHITKGWKRQIVIFMDNVDQRDDHIQEDAFFIANEIASNWPAVVFITLRPSTYAKSKKIGALTGYHPKAFTIAPPKISDVISKRLPFALKIAKGELYSDTLSTGLEIKLQNLTQFIEILHYSFKNNIDLIEFVDNVCSGNVRKAVEYLAIFIGSGHIDTEKILRLDIENEGGKRYKVSIHEFLRAITFREHLDFFPDGTDIVNVFDVIQDEREHFITLLLLDYSKRYSSQGQDGFILTSKLLSFLQDEGFNSKQIEFCILRNIYKGLIEADGRQILNIGDQLPHACRITSSGAYHLEKIINMFTYIDAVVSDVPVMLEEFRNKIKVETYIQGRLNRVSIFCQYLSHVWTTAKFKYEGFNWELVNNRILRDIDKIRSKIS